MESEETRVAGLFQNRPFLFLWSAQVLSQTALNATLYILLVLAEEMTASSTAVGLLIFSHIVPSVVIGPAAGVFVDRWPKKFVLFSSNILRAGIVACFALATDNFALTLLVNLSFSVVSQFFIPAELAMIPVVVPRRQLVTANGLFNFTLSGAQLVGFVFVGPLMAKSANTTGLFLTLAAGYGICALLVALMGLQEPPIARNARDGERTGFTLVIDELREGWRLLLRDATVSMSVLHLTVVNSLVLIVGMLAPGYVSRVLGIRADDAVYVMAPAGIGMLLGVTVLPRLVDRWSKHRISVFGVFVSGAVLVSLSMIGRLSRFITPPEFLTRIGSLALPNATGAVVIVMCLALTMGIAYALVNVSSQTQVQENVPEELRGRVFATQLAFANAAAIIPLVFLGGLADLIGISEVAFIAGTVVLLVSGYSAFQAGKLSKQAA